MDIMWVFVGVGVFAHILFFFFFFFFSFFFLPVQNWGSLS